MALTTIDTYGIKDGAVQIDDIGTLAGNLTINDSGKLRLGTGLDLQLYHDGSNSYITEASGSTPGDLLIQANNIKLRNWDGGQTYLHGTSSGSVDLYHDGNKKFETTANGVNVTGNVVLGDSSYVNLGASTDLQLYHDGTNSYVRSGTGDLRIKSNTIKWVNDANDKTYISGVNGGAVELYYDNSKKFETASGGTINTGWLQVNGGHVNVTDGNAFRCGDSQDLQIYHDGTNSFLDSHTGSLKIRAAAAGNILLEARDGEPGVYIKPDAEVELYYNGNIKFETKNYGVRFYGTLEGVDNEKVQLGSSGDLQIYHDGSNSWIDDAGTGALKIRSQAGGVQILGQSNNNLCAQFDTDGAVSLYHNNVYKAATTSAGFRVNGDFWVDNQTNAGRDLYFDESADSLIFYDNTKAAFGGGSDLQIYHDGTHSYIKNTHATGYTLLQVANGEYGAKLIPNGACELYYDNSKKFNTESSGVQVYGNLRLDDNNQFQCGNAQDLTLHHNGTDSFIDNNTGDLYIQTTGSGDDISIQSADDFTVQVAGTEIAIQAFGDAGVKLYYDNSKKFETTSVGVTVSGTLTTTSHIDLPDSCELLVGNSDDLRVYHSGTTNYIIASSHNLHIDTAGGNENSAKFIQNGAVELYCDNSKKLNTYSGGVEVTGLKVLDNNKLKIGNAEDLQIYHNGTHSRIDNYTGNLYINAASGETGISVIANGSIDLYYDNSKKFETNSSGCQVTGTLWADGIDTGDNEKLLLGDGDDLQIYHNGSDSFVRDQGTGGLYLTGSVVGIKNSSANENGLLFTENGAVELYYDNSKKLGTASWGTQIFGNLQLDDNNILKLGNAGDLLLYHDGSHSYVQDNGTGDLYVQSNSSISIKAADEDSIKCIANGAVQLFYDNSEKIKTISTGVEVTGGIRLGGGTSSNEMSDYEEGTYTIGSVNPSYPHSSQDGKYIKIGRMCFCYGSVTFGNHTDSAHAGVVNPFTADAGRPGALLVRYTSFSGGYKLTGHVSASSTGVTFYYSDNSNAVTYGDLQNKRLDFMIVYATNA